MDKGSVASLIAGILGLLAAVVAFALSRSALREAKFSRDDAAAMLRHALGAEDEHKFTNAYAKSIEQLASDKPAIRLTALHALEDLGRQYPLQRQEIVSALCAYLRMPFEIAHSANITNDEAETSQERQIRSTAQRIITSHLRGAQLADDPDVSTARPDFWPDIELDLTGAVLIDWSLNHGSLRGAVFAEAIFHGPARFAGATFSRATVFDGAMFAGDTSFEAATFYGEARFNGTAFRRAAIFREAVFRWDAGFQGALFGGAANFDAAIFAGYSRFQGAVFTAASSFREASFEGYARFLDTTFAAEPSLTHAKVKVSDSRNDAWPAGWTVGEMTETSGLAELVQRTNGS